MSFILSSHELHTNSQISGWTLSVGKIQASWVHVEKIPAISINALFVKCVGDSFFTTWSLALKQCLLSHDSQQKVFWNSTNFTEIYIWMYLWLFFFNYAIILGLYSWSKSKWLQRSLKKGKSRTSCLYSYNVLSRLHVYCFILFYPRKSLTLAYNLPGVKRHFQSLDVTWQLLRQDAYASITQDNLPLLHEYGPCLKTSLMIKVKSLAGSHFI